MRILTTEEINQISGGNFNWTSPNFNSNMANGAYRGAVVWGAVGAYNGAVAGIPGGPLGMTGGALVGGAAGAFTGAYNGAAGGLAFDGVQKLANNWN